MILISLAPIGSAHGVKKMSCVYTSSVLHGCYAFVHSRGIQRSPREHEIAYKSLKERTLEREILRESFDLMSGQNSPRLKENIRRHRRD